MVGSHIHPGHDLWVRVTRPAWEEAGRFARDRLGCRAFQFLSAIDWMPSPYGRSLDSSVDQQLASGIATADPEGAPQTGAAPDPVAGGYPTGYAGGDTRFQVFARVANLGERWGLTLKVDVPTDDLRLDTWMPNYAGGQLARA